MVIADEDEDVDELKRRVRDLESRNQDLIQIVTREPMTSDTRKTNEEEKTESDHVKKVCLWRMH